LSLPLKAAEKKARAPGAVLLGLLRGGTLPEGALKRWSEVVALAEAHRVGPLLHSTARELPGEARESLQQMRAAALADRGWQHAALLRVQGALEGAGALALHAAAHAEDLYPAPELRPHRTLDLLIAPSRTFAALERLSRRGYQIDPTLSKPDKGWLTLRLRDPRDARVVIDLHRGFPPLPGVPPRGDAEVRSALDAEQLCRRAAGTRLEANDAVVVQALALAAAEFRAPLIWVADLAHLLRRGEMKALLARAHQVSLMPQLAAALALLARCAGSARRLGGAPVESGRLPRLEVPKELARAVDRFELEIAERPGPFAQVARALRRAVAGRGGVE